MINNLGLLGLERTKNQMFKEKQNAITMNVPYRKIGAEEKKYLDQKLEQNFVVTDDFVIKRQDQNNKPLMHNFKFGSSKSNEQLDNSDRNKDSNQYSEKYDIENFAYQDGNRYNNHSNNSNGRNNANHHDNNNGRDNSNRNRNGEHHDNNNSSSRDAYDRSGYGRNENYSSWFKGNDNTDRRDKRDKDYTGGWRDENTSGGERHTNYDSGYKRYSNYDGGYRPNNYDDGIGSNPFSDLTGLIDSDGINDFVHIFNDVTDKLPFNLKNTLFQTGLDVKKIAEKSLEIPEYTKAIKYSTIAVRILLEDPLFDDLRSTKKNETNKIDPKKLEDKIKDLEIFFEQRREDYNNSRGNDDQFFENKDVLERLHQMELALEFKKINEHHLRRTLTEIGIKNVRVAGSTFIIQMNNDIGKIMKITSTIGSIGVQILDKSWKVRNFKTNDPENQELSPLEFLDVSKVRQRRDKLLNRNVRIMLDMLKYIEQTRPRDPRKADIVNSLLKGFYCKPTEVRERIIERDDVKDELVRGMRKLYTF